MVATNNLISGGVYETPSGRIVLVMYNYNGEPFFWNSGWASEEKWGDKEDLNTAVGDDDYDPVKYLGSFTEVAKKIIEGQ